MRRLFSIAAILAAISLCTACFTTMALTAVVLSNITPGEKAIEKQLAKLKADGRISRNGPDKGGSWEVMK